MQTRKAHTDETKMGYSPVSDWMIRFPLPGRAGITPSAYGQAFIKNQPPRAAVTMANAAAPMNSPEPGLTLPLTRDTSSARIQPAESNKMTIAAINHPRIMVFPFVGAWPCCNYGISGGRSSLFVVASRRTAA